MVSLQEAIRLISSEKAKERSEGIELYKDIFQEPHTLQSLTESDDDGRKWLRTMQALFTCVMSDKFACLKKGPWIDAAPISIRRLKESAHMVQWTVEKVHCYYQQPVFLAVFNHLTQFLEDRGMVFEPLAIDYLKALRILLGYQPHLEHLDAESWKYATARCFNILLDDTMGRELDDCNLDDLFEVNNADAATSHRASTMIDAEVTSCLQLLVCASNAPLVGPQRLAIHVLDRYCSFLLYYSTDSTAHLPALQGLNHVLSELEVNESDFLRIFAARVWPSLLSLWSTKSRQVKEQILISFRILLPLLAHKYRYPGEIALLQKKLLEEPDQRFALQPLSLTALELCSSRDEDAFQYTSLRAGRRFTYSDAQTWAALELAADCCLSLYNSRKETDVPQEQIDTRPNKRSKQSNGGPAEQTLDALQIIIDRAIKTTRGHDGKTLQLWSLQMLLFVALRHMRQDQRNDCWLKNVMSGMVELLGHSDLEIQSWSLLVLATLVPSPTSQSTCKQIWPTVCRRVVQSGTSRAASHTAKAILKSKCLQQRVALNELQSIFEDLEMQSPSYAYDSVCAFLQEAMMVMAKDIATARWRPSDKILAWLQSVWMTSSEYSSRHKASGEVRDASDVVSLLLAVCQLPRHTIWPRATLRLPSTAIVNRLQQERCIEEYQMFVLKAQASSRNRYQDSHEAIPGQAQEGTRRGPRLAEVRSLNFIQKGLKMHLQQIKNPTFSTTTTIEQIQRGVDFAVLSLLLNASLQENHISAQSHLIDLAHEVLELSLQTIGQPRWSISEIAVILSSLHPLLCEEDASSPNGLSHNLIERPGTFSGIGTEVLLNSSRAKEQCGQLQQKEDRKSMLWKSSREDSLISAFQKLFDRITSASSHKAIKSVQKEDGDLWADIPFQVNGQGFSLDASHGPDRSFIARICVSAMSGISRLAISDSNGQARLKSCISSEGADVSPLILAGSFFFNKVSNGEIIFTLGELEQLLERIGDEILLEYKYQRSVEAQMLALDFLDATLPQWSTLDPAQFSLVRDVLKLCVYFVKQLNRIALNWKVEKRLGTFLEHFLTAVLEERCQFRDVNSSTLAPEAIVRSLVALDGRADIRVRWNASTMTARLFHVWDRLELDPFDLYTNIQTILPKDTDSIEQMATRILVLSNVLVASSKLRHLALYHLIELTLVDDTFNSYTQTVLCLASKMLGFPTVQGFWLLFASTLTWAIAENKYKIDGVPFQVIGYTSQRQMLESSFQPVASMLIAIGTEEAAAQFHTLATLAGKTQKEASFECIPFLTASELGFVAGKEDAKAGFQKMINKMAKRLQVTAGIVKKSMSDSLDAIVVSILKRFFEPNLQSLSTLLLRENESCASTFKRLEGLSGPSCHEPSIPNTEGTTVYQSLMMLSSQIKETLSSATIYSTIHQMISLIHREQLLNDQYRHIQALKLYLCIAQKNLESNGAIIRLLIHSCAVLIGRVDLVDVVWPLLDWAVDLVKMTLPGLSSSLLLLCRHTRRFTRSKHSTISQVGVSLSERLGRLVARLKESKEGKSAALDAICAWPADYPATLSTREYDISIGKLTNALQATSTVNVFFLQRISRALQRASQEEIIEFKSSTIWVILDRLKKESLDLQERGQIAACLADLLYHCDGTISSPMNATDQASLANRKDVLAAINRIDPSSLQPLLPLKAWLTQQLVDLSRSTDLASAEVAVACLRAVFTNEPQFAGGVARSNDHSLDAEDLRLITSFPAVVVSSKKRSQSELESEESFLKAANYRIWIVWICELLCDLMAETIDCGSFGQISVLMSRNEVFASDTFAVLMHIFLRSDLQFNKDQRINSKALSVHLVGVLRRQQTDVEVWKVVIQAIVQLRHDAPSEEPLACDRWIIDIDYFLLQQRASQCHLYATALLFAELEQEHKESQKVIVDAEATLSLQYDMYSNIDDPDSFYGISNPDVRDSLVNRLQHEGQWNRLFDFYGAQYEGSKASLENIASSLHHQGFNQLSLQLDETQSTSYSAAWRMGKWDLPVDDIKPGTSQSLYVALKSLYNERDTNVIRLSIEQAFACEFTGLVNANVEAIEAIRNNARDLLGLREASQWNSESSTVQSLQRLSDRFEFEDVERMMSVRLSLLRSQRRRLEDGQIGDVPNGETLQLAQKEYSTLLALSRDARRNSKLQIAVNSVTQAEGLAKDLDKTAVEEEFANLLWDLGDHATAIESLARIVKAGEKAMEGKRDSKHSAGSLPLSLARLGYWKATARSYQPRYIRDECFAPATSLLTKSSLSLSEKASVLYQFAAFAHKQYQTLVKSSEGNDLTAFIRYRKEEVEQIELQMKRATVTQKLSRAKEKAEKLMKMDQDKLAEFEKSRMRFRREATYMYASLLPMTDTFDDKTVIRLISLWFENAEDERINKDLKEWLNKVPSRKFLPFVHQLSSRLSIKSSSATSLPFCNSFQSNVRDTVYRMCFEHPFHALTPLYALSRADDDKDGRIQMSRKSGAQFSKATQGSLPVSQLLRKEAASDIINQVATNHQHPKRIKEWKRVCDACVQWARFDLAVQMPTIFGQASDQTATKAKVHVIASSFNLAITRLYDVQVPVLTSHLPVDQTCQYDDFVSIARYSDRFTTAGGVHLPKITDCIGSNGETYRQLFKNLDDLRQDAVMQQVFGVLNGLLTTDREAQKRQLRVRTYAVIPLGPRYGLLEFVGNSQPLQAHLLATHKTHRRAGDITPHEARLRIAKFEFQGKTRKEQAENFEQVSKLLPPTFRFHFLERHKVPITLLTNRLNYTRSVATTSIVGHILGLGDRHVSNILLDDLTGEVVHIDFGVAFDQGKLLPIPELVPFRLTRDMVDAMGLHGVEGVYRRCCQETLRVMREGASVIETVLQVFKYDPLYDWTQNPVKLIRAQANYSQETSSSSTASTLDNAHRRVSHQLQRGSEGKDVAELLAERAIGTVMEKLSTSLSVEYTVNDLMMQARDHANLGSIFSGWQACL